MSLDVADRRTVIAASRACSSVVTQGAPVGSPSFGPAGSEALPPPASCSASTRPLGEVDPPDRSHAAKPRDASGRARAPRSALRSVLDGLSCVCSGGARLGRRTTPPGRLLVGDSDRSIRVDRRDCLVAWRPEKGFAAPAPPRELRGLGVEWVTSVTSNDRGRHRPRVGEVG